MIGSTPSTLPAGFSFAGATDLGVLRWIDFAHRDGRKFNIALSISDPPTTQGEPELILIDGLEWDYRKQTGSVSLTRSYDWGSMAVTGIDISRQESIDFVASLEPAEPSDFPRPILDPNNGEYTTVGQGTKDGRPLTLEVTTDGVRYAIAARTSFLSALGRGCCDELRPGQMIVASGGVAPNPQVLDRTGTADEIIYGLVDEQVSEIQVVLEDGTTVLTVPQDIDDSFDVDFFVVAIPTQGEEIFNGRSAVIAFDEQGNELGRSIL